MKDILLAGRLCNLFSHTCPLTSVNGDAAKALHYIPHGPNEPFLLHEKLAGNIHSPRIQVANDKVPVTSVWRQGNDKFVGDSFPDIYAEAQNLEE